MLHGEETLRVVPRRITTVEHRRLSRASDLEDRKQKVRSPVGWNQRRFRKATLPWKPTNESCHDRWLPERTYLMVTFMNDVNFGDVPFSNCRNLLSNCTPQRTNFEKLLFTKNESISSDVSNTFMNGNRSIWCCMFEIMLYR